MEHEIKPKSCQFERETDTFQTAYKHKHRHAEYIYRIVIQQLTRKMKNLKGPSSSLFNRYSRSNITRNTSEIAGGAAA